MPFRGKSPDSAFFWRAPNKAAATQKALRPAKGGSAFCFIFLEKLGLDIAHLEGADDAAVLALGDT